jgi:hypothetical protein
MPRYPRKLPQKWENMQRFLPCFFDVPAADVQTILGVSHHTLDPMRRNLGLARWPYVDAIRRRFCMTLEEIAALRERMMTVADKDTRKILRRMQRRAEECMARRKALRPLAVKPVVHTDQLARILQDGLAPVPPDDASSDSEVEDDSALMQALTAPGPAEDAAFWEEISEILGGLPVAPEADTAGR